VGFRHFDRVNLFVQCAAAENRRIRAQDDDLAYEAEVSRSYLSQLEKGAFYASLKIIGKLAEALGVEPDELLKRVRISIRRLPHCPAKLQLADKSNTPAGNAV
jgi:transcriptional regulator with XRE-family HTH domain